MFDTEDQRKSSLLMKYLLNFRDVDLRWLQKEHTDGRYLSFSIQSDYFAHNSTELQHQICIYIIILTQLVDQLCEKLYTHTNSLIWFFYYPDRSFMKSWDGLRALVFYLDLCLVPAKLYDLYRPLRSLLRPPYECERPRKRMWRVVRTASSEHQRSHI